MAALEDITKVMPFPLLGIDSDNGSEFINYHLLAWCEDRKLTFTRSRSGNSNDGAHVEQKNWAVVRTVVGYHRYDTPAELLLQGQGPFRAGGRYWDRTSDLFRVRQKYCAQHSPAEHENRPYASPDVHPNPWPLSSN